MEQFRLRQDGFSEFRKRFLAIVIPISLFALFGGLAITYFSSAGQKIDPKVFPIIILFGFAALIIGLYRSLNRHKEQFDSYVLTIDQNGITRAQQNTQTIYISRGDLSEIIKHANGGFTIKGKSSTQVISVPPQIDAYEKLETLLSEMRNFSVSSRQPNLRKYFWLASILPVGLMAAVYISKNKIIVGTCGTVLLAIFGYLIVETQRSRKNEPSVKKNDFWLIVVAVSIAGIMYYKLTGQQ